jgi:osmoprotectant transport system substrate-binding protein
MLAVKSFAGAALALFVSLAPAQAQVVVGSKIDTEGGVLGNIMVAFQQPTASSSAQLRS